MQIINAPDLHYAEFQLLMDAMPAGALLSPCTRPQIWWLMEFPMQHNLPFAIGDLGAWAIWPRMVPAIEIQQQVLMKYECIYY